jgi:hypothetical protein
MNTKKTSPGLAGLNKQSETKQQRHIQVNECCSAKELKNMGNGWSFITVLFHLKFTPTFGTVTFLYAGSTEFMGHPSKPDGKKIIILPPRKW